MESSVIGLDREDDFGRNESKATTSQRRYDVDWLRIIAMGLLIIYHSVISFQPWAWVIGFPQNAESLEGVWILMSMINVWRIPLLFLISGMGVRFAMGRRNWQQLLKDRTLRILLPLVFGFFFIAPISVYISLLYYDQDVAYVPDFGHLWFLANIYLYVLLLMPVLYFLMNRPDNALFRLLTILFSRPWGLVLMALPMVFVAWIVDPSDFVAYAGTPHGFWQGIICFFTGFVFISMRQQFWPAVQQICWPVLFIAFLLFLVRLTAFQLVGVPNALLGFESMLWMLAILGLGATYLNKPSRLLRYASPAVYPVYIVHMPVQFVLAYFLLPTPLPALLKLFVLLVSTFGVSILLYEILRRVKWIRPMFGMKPI